MPVTYKLSNIASVFCGHTFRGRIKDDPKGNGLVIQPQNIEQYEPQIKGQPCKVVSKQVHVSQLLLDGDILFLAKSTRMFAWVYNDVVAVPLVASNLFYIIRLEEGYTSICSDLICFLINNACSEGGELWAKRQGEIAKAIKLSDVGSFRVPIPSVTARDKFMNLYKMWLHERKKTMELLAIKEEFINAVMADVIEKEN